MPAALPDTTVSPVTAACSAQSLTVEIPFLLVFCVSHLFDHAKPINLISAGLLKLHRDVLNGCARLILIIYENNILVADVDTVKG